MSQDDPLSRRFEFADFVTDLFADFGFGDFEVVSALKTDPDAGCGFEIPGQSKPWK